MILTKEELDRAIAAAAEMIKTELSPEEKLVILQLHLACMSYKLYYTKKELNARLPSGDTPPS